MLRRGLPITTALALVATTALVGCSTVDPADTCETPLSAGALSDSVRVSGDSADTLAVDLRAGLEVLRSQRSIVEAAEVRDRIVTEGTIVSANVAYVDGASGEVLEVSPTYGSGVGDALFLAGTESGPIVAGTLCAAVGDTVAIALSAEESSVMGVTGGSLVALANIVDVTDARAQGKQRALPSGFPAVATNEAGQPGIVLPPQQAPRELLSALRIEGTGEVVTEDQMVIGQVLTVAWDGSEQRNSWPQGPQSFGTEAEMQQSGAGFRAALTGKPVGSQVVVIDPSGEVATVSVVDILAVA